MTVEKVRKESIDAVKDILKNHKEGIKPDDINYDVFLKTTINGVLLYFAKQQEMRNDTKNKS
jgi:hypothetical protein